MVLAGGVLPHVSRFKVGELLGAAVASQLAIVAITCNYTGFTPAWFLWGWVWDMSWFTTLPFAGATVVSAGVGWLIRRRLKGGAQ